MNVQRKLTTAHLMQTARTWTDHSSAHVNQDLQEMGKHVTVGLALGRTKKLKPPPLLPYGGKGEVDALSQHFDRVNC